MSTVLAKPLLLVPLSNQIKLLGGKGYNSDCREERVLGSFCNSVSFDTEHGEISLITRNEVQVGLITCSEMYHVYFHGDSGEFTLRRKVEQAKAPKVRLEITSLGYSYEDCLTALKNIWPKRLLWKIENPYEMGRL